MTLSAFGGPSSYPVDRISSADGSRPEINVGCAERSHEEVLRTSLTIMVCYFDCRRGSVKMTCGDCNGAGYVFEGYVQDD
eukprot:4043126-Pyramimonas_sp.AAC.2